MPPVSCIAIPPLIDVRNVRSLDTLDSVKSGENAMSISFVADGSRVKPSQFSTLKPYPSQGTPSTSNPANQIGVRPVFFNLNDLLTDSTGDE